MKRRYLTMKRRKKNYYNKLTRIAATHYDCHNCHLVYNIDVDKLYA